MKIVLVCFVTLGAVFSSLASASEDLFRYKGKTYTVKDLDTKYWFRFFDLELDVYRGKKNLLEDAFLEIYFKEMAAKKKQSVGQVRHELLGLAAPTEAELKKFYEENKNKIPYPYEKVKPELKKFVERKNEQDKKQVLLKKLQEKNEWQVFLKEPKAPKVTIDTTGFARRGKNNAKVTVVEFADYKCPHCKEASLSFKKIYKKFESDVNFVFIDFPIISDVSYRIAEAAYCAGKQGKYWEFHMMGFDNQATLQKDSPGMFADKLALNRGIFDKCLVDKETIKFVKRSKAEGEKIGVAGTPAVYINGSKHTKGFSVDELEQAISAALGGKTSG